MASLTKRKTLIGLLVAALIANLIWISIYQQQEEVADVQFATTTHGYAIDKESLERTPYYDEASGSWNQSGKEIQTLVPLLTDSDPQNIGPDGIGKYIVVRVPKDATTTAYMSTIRALVSEGICLVGFIDNTKPLSSDGLYEANVHEIVEIRNELGRQEKCVDRVNS